MVVVNTHLYGAHLASGGAVLPPHQVVVFDEAHEVEEVMTDSLGVEIGPGRFRALAATARAVLDAELAGAADAADGVAEVGDLFQRVLRPLAGQRVPLNLLVGQGAGQPAIRPADDRGDRGRTPHGTAEPLGLELGLEPVEPAAPARTRAPRPDRPRPVGEPGSPRS